MSSLAEASVLIDRALVTLCSELPESLGLYNTGKDQLSIAALRGVPMLERLPFESRKHFILRDWMRSYVPGEDQALTAEISFDSLRETLKRERKERQRLERLQEAERAGGSPTAATNGKSKKQKRKKQKETKEAGKVKKKAAGKAGASGSRSEKAKAKAKAKSKSKAKTRRQRPGDSDDEGDFVVSDGDASMGSRSSSSEGSSSSSSESESSEEETKESEQREKSTSSRKKKQKKIKSNLPPLEAVLSSDEEEEEANEMFDEGDPDVYEVETVLDKRPGPVAGEPEYLIKWVGYEETTWEPAANVSKDLIDEFEGQPVRENEYAVEEIRDRRSRRDPETRLKTHEYLVKWVGYDETTWEPAENLPHNLRRKFDAKYEARKRRRR